MDFELEHTAILNIKGAEYRLIIWNMSRSNVIDRLNNYDYMKYDCMIKRSL